MQPAANVNPLLSPWDPLNVTLDPATLQASKAEIVGQRITEMEFQSRVKQQLARNKFAKAHYWPTPVSGMYDSAAYELGNENPFRQSQ